MLREWFALRNYPILNKQGLRLIFLQIHFLFLALRKPFKNLPVDLDYIEDSQGDVWINFNVWLKFQLKHISPVFWAYSPVIRGVALVNLDEMYEKDVKTIPIDKRSEINEIAGLYSQTFRFIQEDEFRNWLTRNYIILNAFSAENANSLVESETLAEIGPGLGATISLSQRSNWERIYSLDTFEMQSIFGAIVKKFPNHYSKYNAVSVNDKRNKKPLTLSDDKLTVLAFWSFTELKHEERTQYFEILKSAKRILIGTNEKFEGISNFEYIEHMANSMGMNFTWKNMEDVFKSELPKYQRKHRIYLLQSAK